MPSSCSSSPTAQLFPDLDVDKMNMNAEDIDRLLRDGLTSMGLADLLDDDECDVESSSSPRDIATSSTTSSGTLWSNLHPLGLGRQQPQPRPNHMEVLSQIGAWNNATNNDDGTSPFSAPKTDDDFILTSVGVTTTSGITTESTSSTTLSSIFSTKPSATSSSVVSEHNERILQQLLLSSSGYNSSVTSSSTSSSSSGDNNDGDINDEDDVLSNEITRLFGLRASLLGSSGRPDSTSSTNTTTSTSTTSTSTSTSASTNTSFPVRSGLGFSDDEANTNRSGSTGKSPTSVANFPGPTPMALLDRHYMKILDDLREQMRPLEEAPFLEFGMAWHDLLDTVLSSIYPLADVPDPARGQGQDVQGQNQEDEEAGSPVPMRHYQPLLLECARVWRRSLKEAVERSKEEKRKIGEDGKAKYYFNSLLRREDRHFLVQQAARIVERYLHLHQFFPEDKDAGATSAEVDAYAGSKAHSWDDFSKSSLVDSSRFLDFVYEEILRPAYHMGWVDLINESIKDPSFYVKKDGGQKKLSVSTPNASVEKLRFSSNLLGPVIGAIHTVVGKGRDGKCQEVNAGQPSTESNDAPIIRDWDSILYGLKCSTRAILAAKLSSLGRITVVSSSTGRDEGMISASISPNHFIENKKGYTVQEADRLIQDCVRLWEELAYYRKKQHQALLATDRQLRLAVAAELSEFAFRIINDFQRLHGINVCRGNDYETVPTVYQTAKMMDFVYDSFLLPTFQMGLHNLPIHIVKVKDNQLSLSCIVTGGIFHLRSILYGSSGASREANRFDGKLHIIGICNFAHMLRIEIAKVEACGKKEIASGEADQKLRNSLATWKEASREAWSSRWTALPHQLIELDQTEAELIQLADALVQQYQRLNQMNTEGIDFYLSSLSETCLILDFIYDHFVSHGLALGMKFVRNDSLCGRIDHGNSNKITGCIHMKHRMPEGSYDFLDLVVNGIENLHDRGAVDTAVHYRNKFSQSGNGECKAWLREELPLYATKQ